MSFIREEDNPREVAAMATAVAVGVLLGVLLRALGWL